MNQRISHPSISCIHNKQGSSTYAKMSFPVHCGIYNVIQTDTCIFHCNLNHEVIRIKDRSGSWNHPHEWLQRSLGNDWIYHSTGGYTGVFEATGEYYLPNFQYSSNSVLGGNPFASEPVSSIINSYHSKLEFFANTIDLTEHDSDLLSAVLRNNPEHLAQKAAEFHDIIGGQISVLPPDARHVGYNLIPILTSRGCLYKCRFCKVKNKHVFTELDHQTIKQQISRLKQFYGPDLVNYNSIFLGEHDALKTGVETLLYTLTTAFDAFELTRSYMEGYNCFLFGSVTSFLEAPRRLFDSLQELGFSTYINIGLESPDQKTLDTLGKPITSAMVADAFKRIQEINRSYSQIEITANLLMDESLPGGHYRETEKLLRESQTFQQNKGAVYFSPLSFDSPSRTRLFEFNRLKLMSRFPTYLYIIQRL